jgi:integrase
MTNELPQKTCSFKNGTEKARGFKAGKKIGQAPALSSKLWKAWLDWVLAHAGPRIYAIVFFTGAFGLRMGEAVTLQAADVDLAAEIPKVKVSGETTGNKKSPGTVYVRKQHLKTMKHMFSQGVSVKRTKRHKHAKGKAKTIEVEDVFHLPKSGYLFKSRKNASCPHLHYHAVYDHIRREAPKFLQHLQKSNKRWSSEIAKLRPHSGRATLITELMGEGLTAAISMKYARHSPGSVKVHMRYGQLTLQDVKAACDNVGAGKKHGRQWVKMTVRQLLTAQAEINSELKRRNDSK